MAGGSLSVSGELLYNTKREDFSPNVSLRIGRDSPLILGVESFGNDSVYNVQYGQKRENLISGAGLSVINWVSGLPIKKISGNLMQISLIRMI